MDPADPDWDEGEKPDTTNGPTLVRNLGLVINKVGNPLALMDTSPFRIEVYKDYEEATGILTNQIAKLEQSIPASKYTGGSLSTFSMAASLRIVQEGAEHTLQFQTEKIVPAQIADASKHEIVPGIHIMFPPRISTKAEKDGTGQYLAAVDIADMCTIAPGDDPAAVAFTVTDAPGPLIDIDESSTYETACQTQLCYVIKFNSASAIEPTQFKVLLKNLVNPESIYPAAKIKIRTMLRYAGSTEEKDKRYYFIDEADFDSNFHAD